MRKQVLALAPEGGAANFATNLYFDRVFGCETAKILPGEYYVTTENLGIVTVLGSCVSACLRDTRLNIGGMNHFMLPEGGSCGLDSGSARYGTFAMEVLINHLLKLGARRENLEAKVFGGARVMDALSSSQVGDKNAHFVRGFLALERIRVVADDMLDIYARKVYFFPRTGRVMVKKLVQLRNETLLQREREYAASLRQPIGGDVELF
ncbi:chemoreceptor glutamine deamidase CheD [Viridibacterium curvum]|uniref:Probable chemoreceptor glutamine deamidase CheD n=1 Tax=Viridibacterium curvum TaxID=1101404 RepID=A0ABP9QBA9_9RHOO